ncbi:hypothetical protein LDENG_00034820, partial [Lucifuga dentata]
QIHQRCHLSGSVHLDEGGCGNYVRFADYSSLFNTIVPHFLFSKLHDLGLNTSLCNWAQDFLTGRPQMVRVGCMVSNTLILNTGPPRDAY